MAAALLSVDKFKADLAALASDVEALNAILTMPMARKKPNTSGGLLLTDPLHVLLYGFGEDVATTMAAMRRMHAVSGVRNQTLLFYYQERAKLGGKVEGWIEAHFVTHRPGGMPAKHTMTIIAAVEHDRTPVMSSLLDVFDIDISPP